MAMHARHPADGRRVLVVMRPEARRLDVEQGHEDIDRQHSTIAALRGRACGVPAGYRPGAAA